MEPNLSEYITEYYEEDRYNTDWDSYYDAMAEKADETLKNEVLED